MHTLVYWTKFLRANENVASLCHAVVGVCQHSWWPKPKASSVTESWCLSGSLVSGPSLTGTFRLLQTSGAWFSELDCNQLDINCQFQQQLTSTNYLHYGRWSFLTKKYNSAFWTLDSSTSWIQSGWLQFSDGGTWPSWSMRVPLWDFYPKCPYGPVLLQLGTTEGGVCVQDLASWLGKWCEAEW